MYNPGVIETNNDEFPQLENFSNSKVQIGDNGLDLNTAGHHYYSWGTARGAVKVKSGCWYFEVTLNNRNTCRIGWCTSNYSPENENSLLGGDEESWAVDGGQQKKYHNDSNGQFYGESWNRGDVIGCSIDIEQKKISYTKNGHDLGVAFMNVRTFNYLHPAISVSYDTKVTANFGPFSRPIPSGFFAMNPSVTKKQKKNLEDLFNKYAKKGKDENVILGQGILALANDLGSTGVDDPLISLLMWRLRPKKPAAWEINKQEWMCTWALQGAQNFTDLQDALVNWRESIEDSFVYKNYYIFLYDYLKPSNATVLSVEEALAAWKFVGINKRWDLFDKWCKYWETDAPKKGCFKRCMADVVKFRGKSRFGHFKI